MVHSCRLWHLAAACLPFLPGSERPEQGLDTGKEHGQLALDLERLDDSIQERVMLAFDLPRFNKQVQSFLRSTPPRCGEPLEAVISLTQDAAARVRAVVPEYFSCHTGACLSLLDSWSKFDVLVGDAVAPAQKLARIGKVTKLDRKEDIERELDQAAEANETHVELAFDAGLDLRGCWGDLHDFDDVKVCGDEVMQGLAKSATTELEANTMGKSGSPVFTSLPKFIVKAVHKPKELKVLHGDFFGKVKESIMKQQGHSCYATSLAPTCAALPDAKGELWILMRKVELGRDKYESDTSVARDLRRIDHADLKGPDFASQDGKTKIMQMKETVGVSDDDEWTFKDPGFKELLFPWGVTALGCEATSAAFTMVADTRMLRDNQMTDYSFFGVDFKPKAGVEESTSPPVSFSTHSSVLIGQEGSEDTADSSSHCQCDVRKPRFPLVLTFDQHPPSGQKGEFRPAKLLAAGIIDYLETEAASWIKRMFGSTMQKPDAYREKFLDMLGHYFLMPNVTLRAEKDDQKFRCQVPGGPEDWLMEGGEIEAITGIKWEKHMPKKWELISGKKFSHFDTVYNNANRAGSYHKVEPGDTGHVVRFMSDQWLIVHWQDKKLTSYVFSVEAKHVQSTIAQRSKKQFRCSK